MMMAFLAAPLWTMMHILMVPHATRSLVSGVQGGGCDGAWMNTGDGSTHDGGSMDPNTRKLARSQQSGLDAP
jgi:hypothetical protein